MARARKKIAPEPTAEPAATKWVVIAAAILLIAAFALVPNARSWAEGKLIIAEEEFQLYFDPSAERAYAYAESHFDSADAVTYDLHRARALYREALELDPTIPFARHQLARISFLEENYSEALVLINAEIETNENLSLSSYYIRGLIKGFAGDYDGAAKDYETYLKGDASNWAAINDYAWVLLKGDHPLEALVAIDWGLIFWPDNTWLLNNKATAHYELEQIDLAFDAATRAEASAVGVSEEDWLLAYPGNDPLMASEGVQALRNAIAANMHTILLAQQNEED